MSNLFVCQVLICTDEDDNALKAKLRRLCEKKAGGRLQVPQWLHDEWKSGNHLTMAKQYEACGFNKAMPCYPKTLVTYLHFAKNLF